MDTMTVTKAVAALCGAWLIFLLGNWAAEGLYHIGGKHGDDHRQAYSIDTGEGDASEPEVQEVSFDELYASADPGAGERVWNKGRACHQLEPGVNTTGPYLHGVVGREISAVDGFNYSGALEQMTYDVWSPEALDAFLEDPRGVAPGTSMSFNGLPKPEDRANLIAYLDTFGS